MELKKRFEKLPPVHLARCFGQLALMKLQELACEGEKGIQDAWEGDQDD